MVFLFISMVLMHIKQVKYCTFLLRTKALLKANSFYQEIALFLQGPLPSLFHLTQCFPVTWEMWMVCTGETRPWTSCTRISYASSTPTHREQTHTSQRSEDLSKRFKTGRQQLYTQQMTEYYVFNSFIV